MKACGIICEYNPFHSGHAYQIQRIRQMTGMPVVCAMSGDFTQRGQGACMDKLKRAKTAVCNGADVVLEIPFPFCSMSANGFASSGVYILAKSGLCSHFAFGSECADIDLLTQISQILLSDGFEKSVSEYQKCFPALSYARARSAVIEEKYGTKYAQVLTSPNDILAVEYIKANILLGNPLTPIAIKRSTPRGGFDESFASSSYIRTTLAKHAKNGRIDSIPQEIQKFLPSPVNPLDFYLDDSLFEKFLQLSIMTKTPYDLKNIAEIPHGSQHALIKCAIKAKNYAQLTELLCSKSFTHAKIRRMLLFGVNRVPSCMLKEVPLYTTLLCHSNEGRILLSQNRKEKDIIIASKIANIKTSDKAFEQYTMSRLAREVLEKCR